MKAEKPHIVTQFFSNAHPFAKFVDFEFLETKRERVIVRVVAPITFANGKGNKVLHSGYVTTLLDSMLGGVVFGTLDVPMPIATVSLSINHLRKPEVGEVLLVKANWISTYQELAFVEGSVEVEESGEIIASGNGSFMVGTRATSIRNKDK